MPDPGALPNLLVIGAMKCATSSLHYYLGLHPEIQMSQPKELHFFLDESGFDPDPFVSSPDQVAALEEECCWKHGLDWYREHFSPECAVRGESTVAYTYPWCRGVADRVAETIPDTRLIYVVRDPIERMISHYETFVQIGRESRELDKALAVPENWYLATSRYAAALRPFLDRFPREQLLIVRQDELLSDRRAVLRRIFRFLEVDETFWSREMETLRNRTGAKWGAYHLAERLRATRSVGPVIQRLPAGVKVRAERLLARGGQAASRTLSPDVRAALVRALEPDISALEGLTGWDLGAWRATTPAAVNRAGAPI